MASAGEPQIYTCKLMGRVHQPRQAWRPLDMSAGTEPVRPVFQWRPRVDVTNARSTQQWSEPQRYFEVRGERCCQTGDSRYQDM
jgi:hypothetical protein